MRCVLAMPACVLPNNHGLVQSVESRTTSRTFAVHGERLLISLAIPCPQTQGMRNQMASFQNGHDFLHQMQRFGFVSVAQDNVYIAALQLASSIAANHCHFVSRIHLLCVRKNGICNFLDFISRNFELELFVELHPYLLDSTERLPSILHHVIKIPPSYSRQQVLACGLVKHSSQDEESRTNPFCKTLGL